MRKFRSVLMRPLQARNYVLNPLERVVSQFHFLLLDTLPPPLRVTICNRARRFPSLGAKRQFGILLGALRILRLIN